MIRRCEESELEAIRAIINDGAQAYQGVIPPDRLRSPYMSQSELQHEIHDGVVFWGYEEAGELAAVMGLQQVMDVTLIRHAYVRTVSQKLGIGGRLLAHLLKQTEQPALVGTWGDATWAIRFYERHGFATVSEQEKTRLLKKYWKVPERQIETSVVLADLKWQQDRSPGKPGPPLLRPTL